MGRGWPAPAGRIALIGALVGLGYTVDLGVGPVLLATTAIWIAIQFRKQLGVVILAGVSALPFVLLHHAINYSIAGTLGPANAVADYLRWPGSPFLSQPITGGWNHPSITRFVLYSLDMLFGKRGIFGHDLPLFLVLFAARRSGKSPGGFGRCCCTESLGRSALGCSMARLRRIRRASAARSVGSSADCAGLFCDRAVLRDRRDRRMEFLDLQRRGE